MNTKLKSLSMLACLALTGMAFGQNIRYTAQEIAPPLGELTAAGYALNNNGKILINDWIYDINANTFTAVVAPAGNPVIDLRDINDNNVVLGQARPSLNGNPRRAFKFDGTNSNFIGINWNSTFRHDAYQLNNSGAAVGFLRTSTSTASTNSSDRAGWFESTFGVAEQTGTGFILTTRRSVATAINNAGVMVGQTRLTGFTNDRAVIWNPDIPGSPPTSVAPTNLGIGPGDLSSGAFGINDSGLIIGFSSGLTANLVKAATFTASGTVTVLGRPFGIGSSYTTTAVSNNGVIIGNGNVDGSLSGPSSFRAVVYLDGQGYVINNLVDNPIGGTGFNTVEDINDAGQILTTVTTDTTSKVYLLTPRTVALTEVSGTITFGDWVASGANPTKVFIRNTATQAIFFGGLVTPDAAGNFSLQAAGLDPNTQYDISFDGSIWLNKKISFTTDGAAAASGVSVVLTNGDCDDNNIVDIADYTILATAFGTVPADPTWDVRANLNGDSIVDIADYVILSSNFSAVGD